MSLQLLCFPVFVKLKKKDKMNVSSRDALKRTLLSAFGLALLPNDSKTYVRPSIAFHRHGKVIHLVYGKFEFAFRFHSIRSVASKRRIILLLTCLVCVSYQLYKASAKEIIKNSRAINISISKTVPQSGHLTRFKHTPQTNALLSAFFTGPS